MIAQILDSWNPVLIEGKDVTDFIWQSFDFPSHASIPSMTTGWDSRTGLIRKLTAWKNVEIIVAVNFNWKNADPTTKSGLFSGGSGGLVALARWRWGWW